MKIGFFGTPDIAAFCLEKLAEKYDICFVITANDKKRGRNSRLSYTPVKKLALEKNIPVFQYTNLNEQNVFTDLSEFKADIFIVVAYGYLIPDNIFNLPKYKTINLHPSLLPKYRGAAPMQWAIINGESKTGITIQRLNEKLDAGDILLQKEFELPENFYYSDLYQKVLPLGAEMLINTIENFKNENVNPVAQNHIEATYCSKIDREIAHIKWTDSNMKIYNLIRGLNPKPVAWTTFRGKNMKIWQSKIDKNISDLNLLPGQIMRYQKKRLLVGTGNGFLEIIRLQPENKKEIDALAFINGSRLGEKEFFE